MEGSSSWCNVSSPSQHDFWEQNSDSARRKKTCIWIWKKKPCIFLTEASLGGFFPSSPHFHSLSVRLLLKSSFIQFCIRMSSWLQSITFRLLRKRGNESFPAVRDAHLVHLIHLWHSSYPAEGSILHTICTPHEKPNHRHILAHAFGML